MTGRLHLALLGGLATLLAAAMPGLAGADRPASRRLQCGIAPWTGTCACVLEPGAPAVTFEATARALRQSGLDQAGLEKELARARAGCGAAEPLTGS